MRRAFGSFPVLGAFPIAGSSLVAGSSPVPGSSPGPGLFAACGGIFAVPGGSAVPVLMSGLEESGNSSANAGRATGAGDLRAGRELAKSPPGERC